MGACFGGRAKGVEHENCTFEHIMFAKEQPFSAGSRLGQLTHEARGAVILLKHKIRFIVFLITIFYFFV